MQTNRIEEVLVALAAGSLVIVVDDDEDRENEGDLIGAAELATVESIAFMVEWTSGVLCVALPAERLQDLALPLMVADNTDGISFYEALGRGDVPAVLAYWIHRYNGLKRNASRTTVVPGLVRKPWLDNLLKRLAEDWSGFSAKADDFITEGARVVSFDVYSGTYKKPGSR